MADARPARDAARAAVDRRSELTAHLEDALIILQVEAERPVPSESAIWLARAQSSLTDAYGACDRLCDAIAAAQAEVTKLARQVPVARDSPLRCPKPMVHPDESVEHCILHRDHMQDDTDHVDPHGHHAPVEIHQSTIAEARRVAEEMNGG